MLIVEDEARIIVEIFERYAAGETPRAIAADLNERRVKPPRGSCWAACCIHGEGARGSGILNNELYVGRIVWNKSRMVVNPNTGKRVSQCNDAVEWVRIEADQLRIVPNELCDAVAARKAKKRQEPPQRARAAKRVFSGLLRCGACGSGMSTKGADKTGRTRFQCSRHKESGDCPDPRNYYIDEIEERVLGLLRRELQEPDAIRDRPVAPVLHEPSAVEIFQHLATLDVDRLRVRPGLEWEIWTLLSPSSHFVECEVVLGVCVGEVAHERWIKAIELALAYLASVRDQAIVICRGFSQPFSDPRIAHGPGH